MKNKFDQVINRSKINSFKWKARSLEIEGEQVYPMWVADMEFLNSPAILKRLEDRVHEGIFGYELLSDQYYEAIKYWVKKRHNCEVGSDYILYCANMMCGLSIVLQTYTEEYDEVLMNVPAYGNFYHTIEGCNRVVNESRLVEKDGRFTFDLKDLEEKITEKTKVFLLCNPHNPTGTVWTKEELKQICELCKKYHLFLISDEAHYDFVFSGEHTMMKKIADQYDIPVITMISPGKSFNVAGIQTASLITNRTGMKQELIKKMNEMAYPFEHGFAEAVTIGAYLESEEWFEEVYDYIKGNKELAENYIKENIPLLRVPKSEATYLLWIDCRKMQMTDDEIMCFWKKECKVLPSDGREFGDAGRQYIRLNLACSREVLKQILRQIKDAFDKKVQIWDGDF